MRIMKKNRKENQWVQEADDFRLNTGIHLQNQDYVKMQPSERFFVCLLRGLLIFLALFGTTGLVVTSLELPCNAFLVYIVEFVISMVIALLYYNKWLFNIGYILFFVLFCVVAFYFMTYANSGFNAILNLALELVDEKLTLGGYRAYTETIADRSVTITICLILISFLGVCFFNSSISSYMNPLYLFLQLFPLVQICLYLDNSVNCFYIAVLLVCWLSVFLLRRSGTYRINLNRKQELSFQYTEHSFAYRQRNIVKTMSGVLGVTLLYGTLFIVAVFGIVRMMPSSLRNNQSSMKEGTDEIVGEFAMNGIWGFFNAFQGSGGINGGKLGGVRQVTMDFETDLLVTFVPYSLDPVYLKGYVGEEYTGSEWRQTANYERLAEAPYYFTDFLPLANKESGLLADHFANGELLSGAGTMQITNLDANSDYCYLPYYTQIVPEDLLYADGSSDILKGDIVQSVTPIGRTYMLTYYPLLDEELLNKAEEASEEELLYRDYAYSTYLQIPSGIRQELEEICREQNFHGSTEEIILQIQQFFYENYVYSLSPGRTPERRDFVLYFLTQQKRGYCAHFASAGAMLLRAMGIPARYVEGYCFSVDAATDVEVLEGEAAEEWYEGYSELSTDASQQRVLSFDVADSSAHAWVEVYREGLGWVPVEFTTADSEETGDTTGFWQQFANFFGGGESESGETPAQRLASQVVSSVPYLLLILLAVFGAVLLFLLGKRLLRLYLLYRLGSKKRLVFQYQSMVRILRTYRFTEKKNVYHELWEQIMVQQFSTDAAIAAKYRFLIETASYGKDSLGKEDLKWGTKQFQNFLKSVKKQLNRKQRFLLALRY